MRAHYCQCGRKIVVRSASGGIHVPRDNDHILCQQCYRRELDRNRSVVDEVEPIPALQLPW